MPKNTIFAACASNNHPQVAEAFAGEAGIKAGMLLKKDAGEFVAHDVEGQGGMVYIANLDGLAQSGVDHTYTDGETVFAFAPAPHQFFNVLIASGNNITAKDTALTSNGDGYFKIAATDGTEEVLAYADEVANFSSAAGFCRVKIGSFGFNADTTA